MGEGDSHDFRGGEMPKAFGGIKRVQVNKRSPPAAKENRSSTKKGPVNTQLGTDWLGPGLATREKIKIIAMRESSMTGKEKREDNLNNGQEKITG